MCLCRVSGIAGVQMRCGGGLGESNIGYCSAQNKDALGMKGVRAQSKDPQDEKRNKDGQAMT